MSSEGTRLSERINKKREKTKTKINNNAFEPGIRSRNKLNNAIGLTASRINSALRRVLISCLFFSILLVFYFLLRIGLRPDRAALDRTASNGTALDRTYSNRTCSNGIASELP